MLPPCSLLSWGAFFVSQLHKLYVMDQERFKSESCLLCPTWGRSPKPDRSRRENHDWPDRSSHAIMQLNHDPVLVPRNPSARQMASIFWRGKGRHPPHYARNATKYSCSEKCSEKHGEKRSEAFYRRKTAVWNLSGLCSFRFRDLVGSLLLDPFPKRSGSVSGSLSLSQCTPCLVLLLTRKGTYYDMRQICCRSV